MLLAVEFPGKIGAEFISWLTRADDTIDGKIKQKRLILFLAALLTNVLGATAPFFAGMAFDRQPGREMARRSLRYHLFIHDWRTTFSLSMPILRALSRTLHSSASESNQ